MDKVEMTLEDVGRMGASHYSGDVERAAADAVVLSVTAFLAALDVEDVTESNVLPLVTLSLEDHAETLNHVEVRRLLGLPRADRFSFDAE